MSFRAKVIHGVQIRAPALALENCTTYSKWRNYTAPLTAHEAEKINNGGDPPESVTVHVAYAWSVNGSTEYLVLRTGRPGEEIVQANSSTRNAITLQLLENMMWLL